MYTSPVGGPHHRAHGRGIPLQSVRWVIVIAMLFAAAIAYQVAAQDEEPIDAIQAPLAADTLVLDAVAIDGTLVAVGQRGHILLSSDLGNSWQQAQVPTQAMLTGVDFFDKNLGWAVGHDSAIVRTVDGGATWELVYWAPEDEAPFFDIWFSDAENGVAIGAYGSFFVTSDGGTTWEFSPVGEDYDFHLHKIARSDTGRLYIAAEAGGAFRSDDEGLTWDELPSPYHGSFFGVLPLENDVVLLFGLRGHLFRSEDAGETWTTLETGTHAMLTDGLQLTDGRVVITGLSGTLLVSEDNGNSFELHQLGDRRGIQAVVEVAPDSLLLVGEFGVRILPTGDLAKGAAAP